MTKIVIEKDATPSRGIGVIKGSKFKLRCRSFGLFDVLDEDYPYPARIFYVKPMEGYAPFVEEVQFNRNGDAIFLKIVYTKIFTAEVEYNYENQKIKYERVKLHYVKLANGDDYVIKRETLETKVNPNYEPKNGFYPNSDSYYGWDLD